MKNECFQKKCSKYVLLPLKHILGKVRSCRFVPNFTYKIKEIFNTILKTQPLVVHSGCNIFYNPKVMFHSEISKMILQKQTNLFSAFWGRRILSSDYTAYYQAKHTIIDTKIPPVNKPSASSVYKLTIHKCNLLLI